METMEPAYGAGTQGERAPVSGPLHLVVMGVAGCGKSTIAQVLHDRLGWAFAEGDDFHPEANVAKMASSCPLVDEDRFPWLQILADWVAEHDERGECTILSCSALRRSYRDILRRGGGRTVFIHLVGDKNVLMARMEGREHFMPPSLLESQLDALEHLQPDEEGMSIDIVNPPERIARMVLAQLDLV